MSRKSPNPWWRTERKAWYAWANGRQRKLCDAPSESDREGKRQAHDALLALLARRLLDDRSDRAVTVVAVFEAFLSVNNGVKPWRAGV